VLLLNVEQLEKKQNLPKNHKIIQQKETPKAKKPNAKT